MYWCSTGNTENIMYPKFHNTSFHFMTLQRTGQWFSKRHLENIKPDQCSCCGDITWRSCRDQRLASVESGLTGLESVVVPAGWLAGWVWGQESCCSTVCSEHSGHSVEAEQLSHCSPWPQDSDTAPCSPQVTQHCLCFLYTTWTDRREC